MDHTGIGCINIYDQMRYEMDITIDGPLTTNWGGVFHCGDWSDVTMPLISRHNASYAGGLSDDFVVHFKDDQMQNAGGLTNVALLAVGQTYHVDINVDQSRLNVYIDGTPTSVWDRSKANHNLLTNLPCWVGGSHHGISPSTVANIRITSTSAGAQVQDCSYGSQCAKQKISWEPVDDSSIVPCYARGDPHFQTFDGQHHDYMGEDNGQYYYVSPCHGASYSDMPFNVIGTHMHWAGTATSLKYVTLELIDDDKRYYVYLDGNTRNTKTATRTRLQFGTMALHWV